MRRQSSPVGSIFQARGERQHPLFLGGGGPGIAKKAGVYVGNLAYPYQTATRGLVDRIIKQRSWNPVNSCAFRMSAIGWKARPAGCHGNASLALNRGADF